MTTQTQPTKRSQAVAFMERDIQVEALRLEVVRLEGCHERNKRDGRDTRPTFDAWMAAVKEYSTTASVLRRERNEFILELIRELESAEAERPRMVKDGAR